MSPFPVLQSWWIWKKNGRYLTLWKDDKALEGCTIFAIGCIVCNQIFKNFSLDCRHLCVFETGHLFWSFGRWVFVVSSQHGELLTDSELLVKGSFTKVTCSQILHCVRPKMIYLPFHCHAYLIDEPITLHYLTNALQGYPRWIKHATLVVKYGELVTMDQLISQAWPLSMSNNDSNNKIYIKEYSTVSLKHNPISHCSV